MFEIDTEAGSVLAVSETLAAAMAELLEHEHRRTEVDLLEALRMPLADDLADDVDGDARVLVA